MKNFIFVLVASTFSQASYSNAESEYLYKGLRQANVEIYSTQSINDSDLNYSLRGSYGKFYTDNLIFGISPGISGGVGNIISEVNLGLFSRYYFYKTFFGSASLSYNRSWTDDVIFEDFWSYFFSIGIGYNYFFTKNLAITPSFYFSDDIAQKKYESSDLFRNNGRFYLRTSFSYFF